MSYWNWQIFKKRSRNIKIFISGKLARDKCWSVNRIIISKINDILAYKMSPHRFCFIDQNYGWTRENYKNSVSFSFKDDEFPPLPSPALPNQRSVCNNIGNPASNIMKPFHTKKFDVHRRPGTSNFCNTVVLCS